MHGGGSAPSCCAFTHRVAFEEGSGPQGLLKSGPGSKGSLQIPQFSKGSKRALITLSQTSRCRGISCI